MLTALADGALLAEKFGSTPPRVVALHGWARSGADFAGVLEGLDAVAIHLPGFGITPEPPTAWGSADYADAVAEAIAPFGPVIVVGHSFGGRVAVHLAARHPALVSGILLTGAPVARASAGSKPSLAFRVLRRLAKSGLVSQARLERAREKYGSADYVAAKGLMRGVLVRVVAEQYESELGSISVPVRMVWGEFDTGAPVAAGRLAAQRIPNSSFRVVPGAGHLLEEGLVGELAVELRELMHEVAR